MMQNGLTSVDRVVRQFKEFIYDKNTREALESFFSEEHRLDEFYMNLPSNCKNPCYDLKCIIHGSTYLFEVLS